LNKLIKYDAACKALAAARRVDEVKSIRDKAVAMRLYAKQAKNKDLEADAYEIRIRAERRIGEMHQEQKETIGLNEGTAGRGRPRKGGVAKTPPKKDMRPTLAEAGIDKNLAKRARQLAALSEEEFETLVVDGRADVRRSAERAVVSKISRQEKHKGIAAKASSLASTELVGPFPLIMADPPWKWGHFGEEGQENEKGKGRTPDQHYPTMTYEEIMDFRVGVRSIREIAHKDAVLFLWCTSANLARAIDVMGAWGFEYKTHAVWVKNIAGMGLVFRNKHEIILYGTRGAMPGPQHQPPSVFEAPRGRHSEKPEAIRKAIELMYPDFNSATRLELFARGSTPGWTCHGFEAADIAAE
jgi:N6-adenosine-specific RNA methylase IME4